MPISADFLPKSTFIDKIKGLFNPAGLWNYLKLSGVLLYAQVAASTAVTGATETSTAFDKYYTIPANAPEAGSVYRGKAWGKHTATTGAETHTLALKLGSVTIFESGNLNPADNDYWEVEYEIVFRTVGASGTFVASAKLSYGASGAAGTVERYFKDSTSIDTTLTTNIVAVYIDRQGTATDSDSVRQDAHVVVSHG